LGKQSRGIFHTSSLKSLITFYRQLCMPYYLTDVEFEVSNSNIFIEVLTSGKFRQTSLL